MRRNKIGGVIVVAAAATGLFMGAQGVAQATPTGPAQVAHPMASPCSLNLLTRGGILAGAELECPISSGSYRVEITCVDELRGSSETLYGPVESGGEWSTKYCPVAGGQQFELTHAVKAKG